MDKKNSVPCFIQAIIRNLSYLYDGFLLFLQQVCQLLTLWDDSMAS